MATSVLDARSIFGPGGAPIELSFLRHGDVLGVVFGTDVRDGVIDLMVGAEGATAISSRPGFREAFAGLPDPEDGLDYVDIVALRGQVDQMVGVLREVMAAEMRVPPYGEGDGRGTRGDGGGGVMVSRESLVLNMINQVFDMGLEALAMFDYTASVRHTDGLATYTTSVTVLARDVEDNRFFPLLATGRPVEDFVAHLPATTTGYSVSGGTDTEGLYDFVLGLVGDFGPMGQLALGYWEAMQEQVGFDLRRDVLSWIDGEQISVDFQLDGKAHWLSRMKVTDEAMAAEKLDMVLGMVPDLMDMAAEANPMVMMLGVTVTPTRDPRFEGFHEVGMAMAGESMLVGVRDGAVIFASAGDAIEHCMAVASGTAEGIATNERMMALAMLPAQRGAGVNAASFSDHSGTAAAFAEALAGVSMMGGMVTMGIEEPEVREVVGEVIQILGKLGPVVQALDFYRASSSVATFDGRAWHTRTVTHYAPARGTGTAPAGR